MRTGFISVVGRPNVGKSTLVNALVGEKVAITSPRPQTTRNTIRGILNQPGTQIVFVDTPGLHRPRTALGNRLNRLVYGSLEETDAVLFVLDATQRIGPGDRLIAERLQAAKATTIVIVNKTDIARKDRVLEQLAEAAEWEFAARGGLDGGLQDLAHLAQHALLHRGWRAVHPGELGEPPEDHGDGEDDGARPLQEDLAPVPEPVQDGAEGGKPVRGELHDEVGPLPPQQGAAQEERRTHGRRDAQPVQPEEGEHQQDSVDEPPDPARRCRPYDDHQQ